MKTNFSYVHFYIFFQNNYALQFSSFLKYLRDFEKFVKMSKSVFNNPCLDDSCPIMHNIFPTSVEENALLNNDFSDYEQGCYSSSDGDFVPNKLGIYILLFSYFISPGRFIINTVRNIFRQGRIQILFKNKSFRETNIYLYV